MADRPRRPIVLDAAIGTRLIRDGLDLRVATPALAVLEHPDRIARFHAEDRAAGADVILTATFFSHPAALGRFGAGRRSEEIQREAYAAARSAGPGAIEGSIGGFQPAETGQARDQALQLVGLGCDRIVLETATVATSLAFLAAARREIEIPIVVCLHEPSGIRWDDVIRLEQAGADELGANCHADPADAERDVEALLASTRLPIRIKPGGGLPGRPRITPRAFGEAAGRWFELGVTAVGGCCGTDASHLAEIRRVLDSHPERFGLHSTPEQ